jgi:hypothetical protein
LLRPVWKATWVGWEEEEMRERGERMGEWQVGPTSNSPSSSHVLQTCLGQVSLTGGSQLPKELSTHSPFKSSVFG